MGLALYSDEDYIADMGSNLSVTQLTQTVRSFHRYPKLQELLADGMSKDPVGVRAELDILLAKEKLKAPQRAKLDMLATSLKKVKEIAIISE